jgi:hypothetical protein
VKFIQLNVRYVVKGNRSGHAVVRLVKFWLVDSVYDRIPRLRKHLEKVLQPLYKGRRVEHCRKRGIAQTCSRCGAKELPRLHRTAWL